METEEPVEAEMVDVARKFCPQQQAEEENHESLSEFRKQVLQLQGFLKNFTISGAYILHFQGFPQHL